jgi:ATP adenylyltransferase
MEFIAGKKPKGCFFCKALAERRDQANLLVHRGRECFCIMNRYPYNNGHLMVAANRHVGGLNDLSDSELLELMTLTREAQNVLTRLMKPQGFNLGINLGKVAGAGVVDHLHIHIVPRWNGDTNFMPVTASIKVVPQALDDLCRQLRTAFGHGAT